MVRKCPGPIAALVGTAPSRASTSAAQPPAPQNTTSENMTTTPVSLTWSITTDGRLRAANDDPTTRFPTARNQREPSGQCCPGNCHHIGAGSDSAGQSERIDAPGQFRPRVRCLGLWQCEWAHGGYRRSHSAQYG